MGWSVRTCHLELGLGNVHEPTLPGLYKDYCTSFIGLKDEIEQPHWKHLEQHWFTLWRGLHFIWYLMYVLLISLQIPPSCCYWVIVLLFLYYFESMPVRPCLENKDRFLFPGTQISTMPTVSTNLIAITTWWVKGTQIRSSAIML